MRLVGRLVSLRTATAEDVTALIAIRLTPEVAARWHSDDVERDVRDGIVDGECAVLVIEDQSGNILGAIQWGEEDDPEYRHANIDIYVHPAAHGRGIGADAVRTLSRHLFEVEGHHRITIDPAADNAPAIRCYQKVGFQHVGVMRQYERGADGGFHDGLLMELLADDLT